VAKAGWFDTSTLKEPYRIEGKKTMGIELAEQLGWQLPDVILYPTGGGTGLIGMWEEVAGLGGHGVIGHNRPGEGGGTAGGRLPRARPMRHAGKTPTPSLRASAYRRRSATFSSCARCARAGASPSRLGTKRSPPRSRRSRERKACYYAPKAPPLMPHSSRVSRTDALIAANKPCFSIAQLVSNIHCRRASARSTARGLSTSPRCARSACAKGSHNSTKRFRTAAGGVRLSPSRD